MLQHLVLNGRKMPYFDSRFFVFGKDSFEIVESLSTGPGILDVLHTVKNRKTGAKKKMPMRKLVRILNDKTTRQ